MLLLDPQELEYLLEHLGHPETLKEKKFQNGCWTTITDSCLRE